MGSTKFQVESYIKHSVEEVDLFVYEPSKFNWIFFTQIWVSKVINPLKE